MKRTILFCLLLTACSRSQSGPTKIDKFDLEVLKRTESQLQTLQLKYQNEASPIIKEHDDIVAAYCQKAGLTMGATGTCQMDLAAGIVQKRMPTQQAK